jgi:hypothetical protein
MSEDKRLADDVRNAVMELERALNAAGKEKISIHCDAIKAESFSTDGTTGMWRVPIWCSRTTTL